MTLLKRHDAEGELCCCMDENNLQVVNVDDNGFVTAVKCTRLCVNENCTCRVDIMETICDDDKWTYEELDDEVPIYKGDHICWNRPYALWHHAIVTKVEGGYVQYIHYYNNTVEQKAVPRNKLTACDSGCCGCLSNECNTLYRVNYEDCYTSEYTVMRAEKLCEEKECDLIARNCEQFGHYCKTGSTNSNQINIAWTSLGNVIVSTGLKAVTVLLVLSVYYSLSHFILYTIPLYLYMVVIVFVMYLVKTYASRLSKVPVTTSINSQNTCIRILFCPCLSIIGYLCRNVCIRSLFRSCVGIIRCVCNTVRCRECTCYRRQGHLVCRVRGVTSIFMECCAACGSLVAALFFTISSVVVLFYTVSSVSIILSSLTLSEFLIALIALKVVSIVGYTIGAVIGLWANSCVSRPIKAIIGYVCCNVCNNVSCRECTCYRRPVHLICGLFTHIFIREMVAATCTLIAIGYVWWGPFSRFAKSIIFICFLLAGHAVGYAIGACIGRCFEAICHLCCKCCPKTPVSTSRARNKRIQV